MKNYHSYISKTVSYISKNQMCAEAEIHGSFLAPGINGGTVFYRHNQEKGVFVVCAIFGLPDEKATRCYKLCVSGGAVPFLHRGANPYCKNLRNCKKKIICLPDICGNSGLAFSIFYTEELSADDLVGKSIAIIDKFTEQEIASGLIMPIG